MHTDATFPADVMLILTDRESIAPRPSRRPFPLLPEAALRFIVNIAPVSPCLRGVGELILGRVYPI